MLKKWFLVLLVLMALFAFGACDKEEPTPPPASNPTPPSSNTAQPVVEHSGTLQGGAITWEIYSDGKMVVKGSGAIPDFENAELDQPWWRYGDTKVYGDRNTAEDPIVLVTSIVIEKGITSLGKNAFADQDSVTTVTLPDTLTTLGEACFKDCKNLRTVRGGIGITAIRSDAFNYCTALESIELSGALTTIGWCAFDNLGGGTLTVRFDGTEAQWSAITIADGNTKFKEVEPSYAVQ